jgi:hypothetical protein
MLANSVIVTDTIDKDFSLETVLSASSPGFVTTQLTIVKGIRSNLSTPTSVLK